MSESTSQSRHAPAAPGRTQVASLHALARTLGSAETPESVAAELARHARELLGARSLRLAWPAAPTGPTSPGDGHEGWLELVEAEPPAVPLRASHRLGPEDRTPLAVAFRERRVERSESPEGLVVCVPLVLGDRVVGSAELHREDGRDLRASEWELLETMLHQGASALERASLRARSRRDLEVQRFLAGASETLGASLDPDETLRRITDLAVPAVADWAVVDRFEEDDRVTRVAVRHVDPRKVELAHEAFRRYGPSPDEVRAYRGLPTGILLSHLTDEQLAATAKDEHHLAISRALGFRSAMLVPLRAKGRVTGLVTFVTTSESGRAFGEADLSIALDLARRAGIALENALLYREVEEARQRYRLATEAVRGLVYELDLATGRATHSSGLELVVGFTPSPERASAEWWTSRLHPDDRPAQQAALREALASGAEHLEASYRVLHSHENWRWVRDRARIVRDGTGRALRVVGCTLDVTDEVRYRDELEEAHERKDQFLALLGHELRNPLAALRSAIGVASDPRAPGDAPERAREVMVRQIGHMGRMIDDLLDLSRISAGKLAVREDPVDLGQVARETLADHADAIAAAGLVALLDAPVDPVMVTGDATRLAQIVGNLVHNAVKFTPPGGRISVSLRATGTSTELAVEDDGVGIAPELRQRLFEPFVQGASGGDGGGLGLGLALVHGLVALHHGRIEAHSGGLGCGSRFSVRLPTREQAAEPEDRERGVATARRVLVVEDNADAAAMLSLLLELGGHQVVVAPDGRSAIDRARDHRPEVVLCDIGLPDMDGYAVGRALRAELGPGALLVALTGFGQEEDQRRALDAGFDRHLTKPVDPAVLERLVGEQA